MKWAAPAGGGGKVLQVVQATYDTETTTTSSTYQDTGLTATITPSLATSKVLVLVSQHLQITRNGTSAEGSANLMRGATQILARSSNSFAIGGVSGDLLNRQYTSTTFLDSPATTSATTYKTQMSALSSATIKAQNTGSVSNTTSVIILMEIGA